LHPSTIAGVISDFAISSSDCVAKIIKAFSFARVLSQSLNLSLKEKLEIIC